jgi:hypothetical protein
MNDCSQPKATLSQPLGHLYAHHVVADGYDRSVNCNTGSWSQQAVSVTQNAISVDFSVLERRFVIHEKCDFKEFGLFYYVYDDFCMAACSYDKNFFQINSPRGEASRSPGRFFGCGHEESV